MKAAGMDMAAFGITGDEAVGREIDDAVIGERGALHIGFAGVLAEVNIACGNAEVFCNRIEFVGGIGQLRQDL